MLRSRNGLRRGVCGVDSRKLVTDEIITRTSADIAVGIELDQGLYGDEGKHRLKHTPKR